MTHMRPLSWAKDRFLKTIVCENCLFLFRNNRTLQSRRPLENYAFHRKYHHPTAWSISCRQLHTEKKSDNNNNKNEANPSQAFPLAGYYSDILSMPSMPHSPPTRSQSSIPQEPTPTSSTDQPTTEKVGDTPEKSTAEKMGIVFGTRLAGPGYSSTRYNPSTTSPDSTWRTINGVPVPPRPDEPDNCCMSGCVHCVWDDYRDDVEAWAARVREVKSRGQRKKGGLRKDMRQVPRKEVDSASASMDDDGGGSEASWSSDFSTDAEDLFEGIPVGIREFMKTEKRLKQKRRDADG